jgi:cytochrome P450
LKHAARSVPVPAAPDPKPDHGVTDARSLPGPGRFAALRFFPGRSFVQTLKFAQDAARKYGAIAHFKVFSADFFVVDDADLIRDVLVTHQHDFVKSRGAAVLSRLLGDGLLTSEEPIHRNHRRAIQPTFNGDRMAAYGDVMIRHARKLSAQWKAGESRDMTFEMQGLALGIIGEAIFGTDMAADVDDVRSAIAQVMELFPKAFGPLARLTDRLPAFLPARIEFEHVSKRLEAVIERMIERRRAGPAADDLLSLLLRAGAASETGGMNDRDVRDEVMTILLAGNDTTALALAWTWHLLAQHPEAEAQLHAELRAVLGDRDPTPEDAARLPYTSNVFTEVLRLYPPAWMIGRTAVREVTIGQYTIPRGGTVILSPYITQRNPRYFSAPDAFAPSRWPVAGLPKFAYFPFGGGARVCIGEQFAGLEGVLVLATLARRWRLRADTGPLGISPSITLRPSGPLFMRLEERAAS